MKEIAISEFRSNCMSLREEVRKTRKPIRVTRLGKPIAEVIPPALQPPPKRRLGCLEGTIEIVGDIVGPSGSLDDWEAGRG